MSLFSRDRRRRWLGVPMLGVLGLVVLGAALLTGFHEVVEFSSRNEICYGCHIGMDTVVEEYRESVHFANRTGVQASCSDCHVPTPFVDKLVAKAVAMKDVYVKVVHDPQLEDFEGIRYALAERVRDRMIARDSAECRNCHTPEEWRLDLQTDKSRQNHDPAVWVEKDRTCVSCHIGVAHKKPR